MQKKDKLIESAQKSLQKGQIAKAIKDYEKVLELAPADVRSRQKLAELYNRAGNARQGIEEFEKVGKYYTDNGFYLKAIAVFKQIQKIDPARVDVYHRLAELNCKQGLIGNALAEYRSLVAHYEKKQDTDEVVAVLKKMKEIDPENLNIRVKLAEAYGLMGMKDESLDDFQEVLSVLQQKGQGAKILKLHEIFYGFFPDEPVIVAGLGHALITQGQTDKGIALLQEFLETEPSHQEALRCLALGHRQNGDYAQECRIWEGQLEETPGDLSLRQKQIQACLDGKSFQKALELLEEHKASFLEADQLGALKAYYEQLRDELPDEERVVASLHTIYEATGEGSKLFDILSAAPSEEASALEGGDPLVEEDALAETGGVEAAIAMPEDLTDDLASAVDAQPDSELREEPEEEMSLSFLEETTDADEQLATDDTREDQSLDLDLDLDFDLEEDLEELSLTDTATAEAQEPQLPADDEREESAAADCSSIGEAEGFFDLASEVLDEIEGPQAAPRSSGKDRFGLEGEFSKFKKGVEAQIDSDDAESHYNLGIAYKEMGLLGDAIAEFDQAMRDPARSVDCLTLKGMCFIERGEFESAETALQSGLAGEGLSAVQRISLLFELGLLYEGWGRPLEALEVFQNVADTDMFFRSVGERIEKLKGQLGLDDPEDDDDSSTGDKKDRVSYV